MMVTPTKDRQDMQRLIRMVLDTPINNTKKKALVELAENMSLEDLKGKNTDVKTRIISVQALQACNGERGAAEFLMKYGGLEPIKESQVSLETPVFVDDLGDDELGEPLDVQHESKEDLEDESIIQNAVIYNDPDESG